VRPGSKVTTEEFAILRQHKDEVRALLEAPAPVGTHITPATADHIAQYEAVLGRLWLLENQDTAIRSRHARSRDIEDARHLLAEQARLCDEIGPEFAAAISRQHARRWAEATQRCPYCGEEGVLHDAEQEGTQ